MVKTTNKNNNISDLEFNLKSQKQQELFWYSDCFSRWMSRLNYRNGDSEDIENVIRLIEMETKVSYSKSQKKGIRQLILNLLFIHITEPGYCLRIFLNNNANTKDSAQHEILNISGPTLRKIIYPWVEAGIIEFKKGVDNFSSKIRLAEDWGDKFLAELNRNNVQIDTQKVIFYKDKNDMFYLPTYKVARDSREVLIQDYNELLKNSCITSGEDELRADEKIVCRIFADASCKYGGRLYRAKWMNIKKEERRELLIDGEPLVEFDIKSTFPLIAYSMAGIDYTQLERDAYACDYLDFPEGRQLSKIIVLALFNVDGRDRATVIRQAAGVINKHHKDIKNKVALMYREKMGEEFSLPSLIESLIDKNEPISDWFIGKSDSWKVLHKIESDILLDVIKVHVARGIPLLTVHDSILVPLSYAESSKAFFHSVIFMRLKKLGNIEFRNKEKLLGRKG